MPKYRAHVQQKVVESYWHDFDAPNLGVAKAFAEMHLLPDIGDGKVQADWQYLEQVEGSLALVEIEERPPDHDAAYHEALEARTGATCPDCRAFEAPGG